MPRSAWGPHYGQSDMPCDCTDAAVFAGLARQLPRDAVWVTSHLRRTHETARAIVRAGLPGPTDIPGPDAPVDTGAWRAEFRRLAGPDL